MAKAELWGGRGEGCLWRSWRLIHIFPPGISWWPPSCPVHRFQNHTGHQQTSAGTQRALPKITEICVHSLSLKEVWPRRCNPTKGGEQFPKLQTVPGNSIENMINPGFFHWVCAAQIGLVWPLLTEGDLVVLVFTLWSHAVCNFLVWLHDRADDCPKKYVHTVSMSESVSVFISVSASVTSITKNQNSCQFSSLFHVHNSLDRHLSVILFKGLIR